MDRIPQSNQLNPAFQPNCNFYFGVPGLSSLYIDLSNNSLSVNKVLQYNKSLDSVIYFLNPNADRNIFFDALKNENNFFTNLQEDILSFGFRVGRMYFTFNSSIKNNIFLNYPKSLAELAINGSDVNTITNLKSFKINETAYAEVSLGLSDRISDEFTVGARIKVLSGLLNVTTKNNKFLIETYEDQEGKFVNSFSTDFALDVYAPYLEDTPNGNDITLDSIFNVKDKPYKSIKPLQSKGFGVDIGISYSGIDNMLLSASLIDLGFISWKKNVYEYKMRSSYSIAGKILGIDSVENAFKDSPFGSINDSITFSKQSQKLTTALPTKLYLSGEYFFETYFSVGLLSVSQYYLEDFYQQFTFSANFRPLRALMLSISYSVLNNGFDNLGIGLSIRPLPPLQIYFLSDNIPVRYGNQYIPIYAKSLNLRFGLNFTFGYSQRRLYKDKPLSWE
jgi:hypothetical protein